MSEIDSGYDFDSTQHLPDISGDTEPLPDVGRTSLSSQRKRTNTSVSRVVTRRSVNKAFLGAIGASVLGGIFKNLNNETEAVESVQHQEVPSIQQTQEAQQIETREHVQTVEQLNQILNMELLVYERNIQEQKFAEEVRILEDIDLGLSVCADMSARAILMQKRNELREMGHEGMIRLTEEQKKFCREEDVSEEVLGMCLDVYDQAKVIIHNIQPKIRDDEEGRLTDPENLMINAGGMAKLIMEETSGFINVGQAKAVTQLFIYDATLGKDIPDENNKNNLQKLCELASSNSELKYNFENVPGSERGDISVNSSGGAVGIQFMPDRALEYYNKIVVEGGFDPKKEGNVFNPLQSIKMAWAFIACHEKVAPGPDGYRWGYMRGNAEAIDLAIRKWNNLESEVNAIKNAIEEYDENVPLSQE